MALYYTFRLQALSFADGVAAVFWLVSVQGVVKQIIQERACCYWV
jgi:hypothetical protein